MFTKLNRVLLASGLVIASAALLSPSAFAQITVTATPLVVTGTPTAFAAITVTGSGNAFPITEVAPID